MHNALAFANAWHARTFGYLLLLRDEYPPVGDEPAQVGDVPAPGQPALGGSAATARAVEPLAERLQPGSSRARATR